ncbi:hypothetical protein ACLMJK_007881 [Lecanora helva]
MEIGRAVIRKITNNRIVRGIRRRLAESQANRALRRSDGETYGEWTEEEGELCRVRTEALHKIVGG